MTNTTTPLTREQALEQALQMVEPALGILRDMGPIVCKYLPGLDTVAAEVAAALATPATQQAEPTITVEARLNRRFQPAAPLVDKPDDNKVICPNCAHQFRAIPCAVQRLMLDAGFEPPFVAAPLVGEPVGYWPHCPVCGAGGNCAHRDSAAPLVGEKAEPRTMRALCDAVDILFRSATPTKNDEASVNLTALNAIHSLVRTLANAPPAAEQAAPPQTPEPELSSAEQFWIERRRAIIEALTARGLEICNDDNNVWLQEFKRAAPVAAEQTAQTPEPVAWQYSTWDALDGWSGWKEFTAGVLPTYQKWAAESPNKRRIRPLYATPEQAAPLPQGADARQAFELGWRTAANWTERDDLIADIGSPAYIADRDAAIAGSATCT